MKNFIDLTGETYGRLTVVEFIERKNNQSYFKCKCVCGRETTTTSNALRMGKTQSCGCLKMERIVEALTTHGESGKKKRTPEYKVWAQMKARCDNPKNKRHNTYGARGIRVCEGFREYENFIKDMGRRPSDEHSIDRVDNDLNYSCGHCDECVREGWNLNCRWGTEEQQCRNTTRNRWLEHNGKKMILCDWAKELGVGHTSLIKQLKKKSFSEAIDYFNSSEHKARRGRPLRLLTEDQVIEIKKAYIKRKPFQSDELAAKYGISRNGVRKILMGQTWQHLNHYLQK